MKKFLLAGASTLAILGFVGSANAQVIGVDVDLEALQSVVQGDGDGLGGFYINGAFNNQLVDGSVDIDTDGLIPGVNISAIDASIAASGAVAGATAGGSLTLVPLGLTLPSIGVSAAAAVDIGLDITGTVIASTDVIETSAIGAVNSGSLAVAAVNNRTQANFTSSRNDAGDTNSTTSASDSAANTSSTAARAAAAATSLLIDGATSAVDNRITDAQVSGPAALVAANLAVNNAIVDGSVDINDATRVALDGISTSAIGAVNSGNLTSGLPGSITITVAPGSSGGSGADAE